MSILSDLLVAIAGRVRDVELDHAVRAAVEDVLVNNGLNDDAPAWFVDLMQALFDGQPKERTLFPEEVMDNSRWGITNALAELTPILGIERDDYGEGILLGSPRLGTRAFISREALGRNYSYEVERI